MDYEECFEGDENAYIGIDNLWSVCFIQGCFGRREGDKNVHLCGITSWA